MTKGERLLAIDKLTDEETRVLFALILDLIKNRPPAEAPQETANPKEK